MNFAELEKIDITGHLEKKGRFTYLSWPFAVAAFRKACPNGMWMVKHFKCEGLMEQPYCETTNGCFVEVVVWPDIENEQLSFTQVHPVLDNKNKTVENPNAFQINTSIQRCLVKAIALATGIGLHVYAGEDLPPGDEGAKHQAADMDNFIAELMQEMDKCESLDQLKQWWDDNQKRIKTITGNPRKKLDSYKEQLKDVFSPSELPGVTVPNEAA